MAAPRACVWCHRRPVSPEHVWPDWLSRALPDPGSLAHVRSREDMAELVHHAPPFTTKVKRVCGTCNTGWMSQLEEEVKPIALPLIQGQPHKLEARQQRTLAFWAIKTGMMFQFATPPPWFIPDLHFDELYRSRGTRTPLANSQVQLAAYGGQRQFAGFFAQPLAMTALNPDPRFPPGQGMVANAYGVTLSLNQLVLQYFAHSVQGIPRLRMIPRGFEDVITVIWPSSPGVRWPPSRWLGDGELSALENAFRNMPDTVIPAPASKGSS
jgi:hypothetical protein